jgi:choice-of-anchor B domain-containing protein
MRMLTVLAVWLLSLLPLTAMAHSSMFLDDFILDESNDGAGLPYDEVKRLQQRFDNVAVPCQGGSAGGYPCRNVDLMSFTAKQDMGGGSANLNDIWGWTDPATGREYAIVGRTNGTSFLDVTEATNPQYLGFLPSHNGGTDTWRDMKIFMDHAFIVADGSGNRTHGLQVFDLTNLRDIGSPLTFEETAHHAGFGNAHNIAINEDTGFAYIVGSNKCSGGLYMVDISSPTNPNYAGCFSSDGYTHDTQCVVYNGPDTDYVGKEICMGYNEDTLTIIDVDNKSNPVQISRTGYDNARYTHQGWLLNDDHSILILNDELDESGLGHNTKSYIFDVSDLDNPVELGAYFGPTKAIDHNLYAKDGFVYETNYRAGLRIMSTKEIGSGKMEEVAYFDTIPNSNSAQFSGTWSSYIYFDSGNVIASDIANGLFVLRPNLQDDVPPQPSFCSVNGRGKYEGIGQVRIGGFSHSSGAELSGYQDFTDQVARLSAGNILDVALTPVFPKDGTYEEYWRIWVDLNFDGDFKDPDELVFDSGYASSNTMTGELSIPQSALTDKTLRMRVGMRWKQAAEACGSIDWGEYEDYSLQVQ